MVYGRKRIARRTRRPVIRRVRRTAVRKGTRRVMYRARRYRTPTEFPTVQFVKLKAAQDFVLQLSSGSGQATQYALNDVYDPYIGLDTQHVSGYAAWAAMYRKSIVYGCKVRFSGVVTSNDSSHVVVGMLGSDAGAELPSSTSAYGDWLVESKGAVKRRIPPWISPQPYPRFSMKRYYNIAKTQGITSLDSTHYGAETNASPPILVRLMCVLAGVNGNTATCYAQCRVELVYYTRFSAPRVASNAQV